MAFSRVALVCWACLRLEAAADAEQRTIMLVGGTGNGKSETGNTILGKTAFKVSARQRSETRHLQHGSTIQRGSQYLVCDTPGWFGAGMDQAEAEAKIEELATRSDRGVDAFLLVVGYGRFDDQAMRNFQTFKNMFGAAAMKHTTLVFTKASNFSREEISQETAEICQEEPSSNQCKVLQEIGSGRILAIGDLSQERRRADREQVLEQVEALSATNGGAPYDHEVFRKKRRARTALHQRIEQLVNSGTREAFLRMLKEVQRGDATDAELESKISEAEAEEQRLLQAEEQRRREAEHRAEELRQEQMQRRQAEEQRRQAESARQLAEQNYRAEQQRAEEQRRAHEERIMQQQQQFAEERRSYRDRPVYYSGGDQLLAAAAGAFATLMLMR